MLLIFSVNMHELFLWKIRKVLQLPMLFKIYQKNLIANQAKFGYRSMKSWLEKNAIEMLSEWRRIVIAENFFRILKNNIYKYMTSISKTVWINKSDDIVNKYNNTYHNTIKMSQLM